MRVKLIKPWSIWTQPFYKDCIAMFSLMNGMYKEFDGCVFGISSERMDYLIQIGYAIKY